MVNKKARKLSRTKSSKSGKRASSNSRVAAPKRKRSACPGPAKNKSAAPPKANNVQIVNRRTPNKPLNDPNDYRILTLSTGLNICLISHRPQPSCDGSLPPNRCQRQNDEDLMPTIDNPLTILRELAPIETETGIPIAEDADKKTRKPRRSKFTGCDSFTSVCAVVNIGSIDNPPHCQGLAHFTEHMVHYGSKKFPEEDGRDSLVMNFGTISNAFTTEHFTTYFYEIPDYFLDTSLDMLIDMLSYPKLTPDMLQREVHAVDNEFNMKRHLDGLRRWMLIQHVGMMPKHPMAQFSCGSLQTLDTKNATMKETMTQFQKENYVASAMTMCINSTQSLDDLENLIMKHCPALLEGERSTFENEAVDKSLKAPKNVLQRNMKKLTIMQGTGCCCMLSLFWELPADLWMKNEDEKVLSLIERMFAENAPGSLDHCLRQKQLAFFTRACSNSHVHRTSFASLFQIDVYLTYKGMNEVDAVLAATFDYIANLKTTKARDLERLLIEGKLLHQRLSKSPCPCDINDTLGFALTLQITENHANVGSLAQNTWNNAYLNYDRVMDTLNLFQMGNLAVVQTLPKTIPIETFQAINQAGLKILTAPYTQTKYCEIPLGDYKRDNVDKYPFSFVPINSYLKNKLQTFMQQTQHVGGGDGTNVQFQLQNVGNIKKQVLIWEDKNNFMCNGGFPRISGRHWGHEENEANPYDGDIVMSFCSPVVYKSARSRALVQLWIYSVYHQLADYSSEILSSGNSYSISCQQDKVVLEVSGTSNDQKYIAKKVLSVMFQNEPITENVFDVSKQMLTCFYTNQLGQADQIIKDMLNSMFHDKVDSHVDALHEIDLLTIDDLDSSIQLFKRSSYVVINLMGNISVNTFHAMANFIGGLNIGPSIGNPVAYSIIPLNVAVLYPLRIPWGELCMRVKSTQMSSYCTTVSNFYCVGPYSPENHEMLRCALSFMRCQAFHFLRTKHQLGYCVQVDSHSRLPMVFTITVAATAKKFSPCEIDERIDEFLEFYGKYLCELDEAQFEVMADFKDFQDFATLKNVTAWYNNIFKDFRLKDYSYKCLERNIGKLSMQVIGLEEKNCQCETCASIKEWKHGKSLQSSLRFATGSGITTDYFIDDVKIKNINK